MSRIPTSPIKPATTSIKPATTSIKPTTPPIKPTPSPIKPATSPIKPTPSPIKPAEPQMKPVASPMRPRVIDKDSFDIMNPNPDGLKIVMTVALPALHSKKIIWLALESLRLQENIDFGWELIVWEEWAESKAIVESFVNRLPNCLRVRYRSLKTQIPLIRKWMGIRDEASKTSEVYVLQAADCFSPTRRLWIHRQHFLRHPDCILSTQYKGLFYNIITGQKILYKLNERRFNLNMAYRMSYMSRVVATSAKRGIDGHIWKCVRGQPHNIQMSNSVDSENWMTGMDTDGYNNISLGRKKFYDEISPPFYPYNKEKCWKHVPEHVKKYLKSLRPTISG